MVWTQIGAFDSSEVRLRHGGSRIGASAQDLLRGEHGIGLGTQHWLVEELGESVEDMRKLKRALDPLNILTPGKVFQL